MKILSFIYLSILLSFTGLTQSRPATSAPYDILIRNGLMSIKKTDTQFGKAHPRAFGNFARLLGKYVREEKIITLEETIRRLTSLPATNHKLTNRGLLKPGYFADVVIFDPATIADKATFDNPFQYAVGVEHVFINGKQVLKAGTHTGVFPGRALWGPGKK